MLVIQDLSFGEGFDSGKTGFGPLVFGFARHLCRTSGSVLYVRPLAVFQSGAHQNDTAIEPSTSDVSTSSVVHWKDEFSNSKEAGLSTRFIGDTYNNAGKDHCNTAAEAAVAGAASGYAEAWDNVNWYWDGDLLANFEGSYNGAAWNVLANSELKLHFKIKSNGDQLGQTYAKYKSSFLGDYWHEESNYDEYIFVPSAPDSFTVKMKGYSVAAAIGTSTTAISAADPLGSNHHGYFDLDHYTLDHQ